MSFFSWLKNLFVEDVNDEIQEEEIKQELINMDYKLKIFDLKNKDELDQVTSFIVQDKTIALIKMNKFTGDHHKLKETLNESLFSFNGEIDKREFAYSFVVSSEPKKTRFMEAFLE